VSEAACGSCDAKGVCGMTETNAKHVRITQNAQNYYIGQQVRIFLQESKAMNAVLLAYVFPAVVLIGSLAVFVQYVSDALAALYALLLLALYYAILRNFRKKISTQFVFEIQAA
jgi:sigma-E factor negative regulatory protein RseC